MNLLHRISRKLGMKSKPSFSLNALDLKLRKYIKKRNGFFVEVGANDGITQSNSLLLEQKYGWTGLLIEAVPELSKKCAQNRPNCIVENCALVSEGYKEKTIQMHYCNLMSFISNDIVDEEEHLQKGRRFLKNDDGDYLIDVPVATLSSVLDKHNIQQIDLFSLDVEGYEIEVLKGMDFSRHLPKYLLIEVRDKINIEEIISAYYMQKAILQSNEDYADILYKRRKSQR